MNGAQRVGRAGIPEDGISILNLHVKNKGKNIQSSRHCATC